MADLGLEWRMAFILKWIILYWFVPISSRSISTHMWWSKWLGLDWPNHIASLFCCLYKLNVFVPLTNNKYLQWCSLEFQMNNMSKLFTLFIAALLLNFMLCYATRPDPAFLLTKHQALFLSFLFFLPNLIISMFFFCSYSISLINNKVWFWLMQGVDIDDNCEGVGKEESLMRRTLAAHLDYIYTQNHKSWGWYWFNCKL